ncbi:helix-turn-helix transcriptional regulator [Bradyrhizobium sp. AUGA SZCCT0431]|nr:AraC family transcriptional regulator [Bradyrhizobium sp. AUGA SZCCT0431]MBR1144784.1 helix-turn-helix transcriptional regulator [Bradyrhizobium sp. AUGA SZCCT0431]
MAVGGRIQKVVFASEQLPSHLKDQEKFSLWQDQWNALYGSVDLKRAEDRPFAVNLEFAPIGAVGSDRLDGSIDGMRRSQRDVASDSADNFCVALHNGRSDIISIQNGQEGNRDAAVLLTAEPGEMLRGPENGWYAINISRARLLALVPNADDLIGKPLDASSPALRHLGRYVEFLMGLKQDGDPALDRHIETTLVDLVALALGARGDPSEIAVTRGLRAARLHDVLAAIKSGFHDPEFSSQSVAQRLGLSRRYVNDLLAESGSGFAERVLEMRLHEARVMLTDAAHDRLKVSEIAWTCGFNEVPYFNRRFRRRFGMTPTELREASRRTK